MKRWWVVGWVGLILVAPEARAQTSEHDKALQAFRDARTDIEGGNCGAAVPKLEESLAYEPSVGAHLSLADCYEQIDLLATWKQLKEAALLAAEKNDERATIARKRAADLEQILPTMQLVVTGVALASPGLTVRVDDSLVKPSLYREGLVATTLGSHDVEVIAPERKRWHRRVDVKTAGSPVLVTVALETDRATLPATPIGPPGTDSTPAPAWRDDVDARVRQQTIAVALGALGAAGVVLGTVSGIVALAKNQELKNACGGHVDRCTAPAGSSRVNDPRDAAQSAATLSTVGFVAGGIALAAGAILWVLAPSPRAGGVAIAPLAGPGVVGVSMRGAL